MMENQYENVKAALRWANQMEEAFPTQTNMLCRNAINSGGAQPFERFSGAIIGESIPYVCE
jgi:hypothetical protein